MDNAENQGDETGDEAVQDRGEADFDAAILCPSRHLVTFTSDYKKVSLKKEDILYVDSRDSELLIVTRDGLQYRNRTVIGQWENLLGPGLLRIHRSFLVHTADASFVSPDSIFIGIDYVSCSPFRVPIARLAAAQAQIRQSK